MIPSDHTEVESAGSEARARLSEALGRAYRSGSVPARVDLAVQRATLASPAPRHPRRHLPSLRTVPVRAAAAGAAALLIAGGAMLHLQGGGATPVSAATVMKRAATADLLPNQVSHFTYRLSSSAGDTETSNVWVGADTQGQPSQLALDISRSPAGTLERLVDSGQGLALYDAQTDTVTEPVKELSDQPWSAMMLGTRLATKISSVDRLPADARKQPFASLSEETLDGSSVYVLSDMPNPGEAFYIDTHTYVLRGADWVEGSVRWQARLEAVQTLPLASVPANTFSLNAPADARVVQPPPDVTDYPLDLDAAISAVCHTTGSTSKQAAVGNGGMLDVCRQTNPGITRDQFIAAMSVNLKSQLDAAVAAGKLTAQQAADELARIETKLSASM